MSRLSFFTFLFFCSIISLHTIGQSTQIKGFVDVNGSFGKDKASFSLGEQDLFITSTINDRVSFLGETVFKYTPSTPTEFSVSVERIIINYNIKGNHNLIVGKVHTPVNYWNDTYHHGRVFFPTIDRPLLFSENIIPLHSIGAGFQGNNLGKLKFGYNAFVGNSMGGHLGMNMSNYKALTLAAYIKPTRKMKIGVSWYHDVLAKGSEIHGKTLNWKVTQNLTSLSIANFGKKFEFLAEGTAGFNKTDTTGQKTTLASYVYAGYKIKEKIIPYVRFDNIKYQEGEIYYHPNNMSKLVAGIRYQLNYLAVVKLEYQYQHSEMMSDANNIIAQFAIGF